MQNREERNYYQWLERIVRKQKGQQSLYYDKNSGEERDIEILKLVNYVRKHYPKLLNKLLANTIDATQIKNITKEHIFKFLGKAEKGTVVTWTDKNGNELVFVNAGEGLSLNKKRIVILGSSVKNKDIELLKRGLLSELLRKDVEHVYQKIYNRQIHNNIKTSFIQELFSTQQDTIHSARNFEKNFKQMIKEQGYGSSPMNTAKIMIHTMSGSEKNILSKFFASMGVKTSEDMQQLLVRWKTEALTEQPKRKISRSKTQSVGLSR